MSHDTTQTDGDLKTKENKSQLICLFKYIWPKNKTFSPFFEDLSVKLDSLDFFPFIVIIEENCFGTV